jgi:hemoglobin-like flavoprotein
MPVPERSCSTTVVQETFMTPEQVQLVQRSFVEVAALGDQVAVLFYQRLFELDPTLRPLFNDDLAAQRGKLLSALALVVDALDRPEEILPAVSELGRRHAGYGVEPDHYATVGSALIWTLEQGLDAEFTAPLRQAWREAYGLLAWTMIAAAEAALRERYAA